MFSHLHWSMHPSCYMSDSTQVYNDAFHQFLEFVLNFYVLLKQHYFALTALIRQSRIVAIWDTNIMKPNRIQNLAMNNEHQWCSFWTQQSQQPHTHSKPSPYTLMRGQHSKWWWVVDNKDKLQILTNKSYNKTKWLIVTNKAYDKASGGSWPPRSMIRSMVNCCQQGPWQGQIGFVANKANPNGGL